MLAARSESMTVPWAAGSIYSTTGDLLKWEHGLFGVSGFPEADDDSRQMGDQLCDVVLGRPVVLASGHKAVAIAKEELAKFVGVYDLAPTFALTVAIAGDALTVQGSNQPALAVMYQGVKDGHPTFYAPQPNAEIELVPDAEGAITSMILHQGGQDMPAKRH